MQVHGVIKNPGKKEGGEDTRRFARLLFFAHALEKGAVAVPASFADKKLDHGSGTQAEPCKRDEICRLGQQPVLGKDNKKYQRDDHPCLICESVWPFSAVREEPGQVTENDMAAVLCTGGTFGAERVDDDKN